MSITKVISLICLSIAIAYSAGLATGVYWREEPPSEASAPLEFEGKKLSGSSILPGGKLRLDRLPGGLTALDILSSDYSSQLQPNERMLADAIWDSSAEMVTRELDRVLESSRERDAAILLGRIAATRLLFLIGFDSDVLAEYGRCDEECIELWYAIAKKVSERQVTVQCTEFEYPTLLAVKAESNVRVGLRFTEIALRMDPSNPHAYIARARLEILRGNLEEAKALANQAVSLIDTFVDYPLPAHLSGAPKTEVDKYMRRPRMELACRAWIVLAVAQAKTGEIENASESLAQAEDSLRPLRSSASQLEYRYYRTLVELGVAQE